MTPLRQSNPFDLIHLVCLAIKRTIDKETSLGAKALRGVGALISRRESVHTFANTGLKWVTFTPELSSGWSVIRSSFWRSFHFQPIQPCFGSCSVENKMKILLVLKENSHSPQLRGTTINDSILILFMRSPFPIPKHQCSTCEGSIMSCIMKQATKQLVGPTLFESERIGMECHCLPHGSYFSFLPPLALYSVKLTLPREKFKSSVSMTRTLWRPGSIFAYSYNHKHFFSISAMMFSIHILSGKSF